MGLEIFENFTSTNDKTIDSFWHSIQISLDFVSFSQLIKNKYKTYDIEENDFNEILVKDNNFEITFTLSNSGNGMNILNIAVFSKRRGQSRRKLEEVIEEIRKDFKSCIIK